MAGKMSKAEEAAIAATKPAPEWKIPDTVSERRVVVARGLDGKSKSAEAHALACLRAHPNELGLRTGDSVDTILDLVTSSPVHREIVQQQAERKRAELAGQRPSPLENLLIDRVLACWLSVQFYEQQCANKTRAGSIPLSVSEHLQNRIDKAQKRELAAIKTLAQVRRLQIPVNVQVNVAAAGGQQVNIAGNVTPQTAPAVPAREENPTNPTPIKKANLTKSYT